MIGAVAFSEFFLLTLYLQEVLGYSALQSGVAFSAFALTVVVASNVAQAVVGRVGVRATLTTGLALSVVSLAALTRVPLDGHYLWDLFPFFVLGGAGMGFSFVPATIASLDGVDRSDAGVALGLMNTSRQIGGAIGLAAASTIAATATHGYAGHPRRGGDGGPRARSRLPGGALRAHRASALALVVVRTFMRPPATEARAEPEPVALEEAA